MATRSIKRHNLFLFPLHRIVIIFIIFLITLFWAMDEMMLYYQLVISPKVNNVSNKALNFVETKFTGIAQEGTGLDATGNTFVSGDYDADSIGYFGAFWFWLQWETGATDDTAFACVTLNDGLGGQAYGVQFDLYQGSLHSFMIYAYNADPVKYAAFKQPIEMSASELYANSMSDLMPTIWTTLYNADPEGFKNIQKQYIYDEYWPSIETYLKKTDFDYESRPEVVKGAIMSYGHQHGPSSGSGMTWVKTFAGAGITNATSDEDFITKLYTFRMNRKPKYTSRYKAEMVCALELLAQEKALAQSSGDSEISLDGENNPNATLEGELVWPVPSSLYISSHFGYRNIGSSHSTAHKGIDIAEVDGMPVVSAADGEVTKSYYSDSYGNTVIIQHDGFATLYAHLTDRNVSSGEKVKAGQQVGTIGNTGNSAGNHLHFEIRIPTTDSDKVNPVLYYQHINYTIDPKYSCCARGSRTYCSYN